MVIYGTAPELQGKGLDPVCRVWGTAISTKYSIN